MAPITDCMKNISFVWSQEASLAFEVIKTKLTTDPILYFLTSINLSNYIVTQAS